MVGLRAAAAAVVALYALVLAFGAGAGFPTGLTTGSWFPYLSDQPVGEDGYYLLLVAWNLARGQGLTANFGEVVTGIQPLMTFALAGVAWIVQAAGGGKFEFARAMILFGGANALAFAALMARNARLALPENADRETGAAVAFIGAALSFFLLRTFTYGLETGLYLVLIAALLGVTLERLRGEPVSVGAAIAIGVLVGLCGLARIDFGLVAALVFGALFLRRRISFARAALAGVIALAITAPWFMWVKSVSGTFMPSSGPAQASLVDWGSAAGRGETMALAVAQNVAPWAPLAYDPWASLAAVAAVAGVLIAGALAGRGPMLRPGAGEGLAAWSLGVLVLPFVYVAFFWAAHFYARYTAPIAVLSLLVTAVAAARLPDAVRRRFALAAFVALLGLNAHAAWRTHHSGGISDGHSVAAGYVARHLPKEARVGAFQSGVVGFYNENVINLDGKVNVAALAAMRAKNVEAYLDAAKIDYVIDWQGVIEGLMPRAMASGQWERCPIPVGNKETICVRRIGAPLAKTAPAP